MIGCYENIYEYLEDAYGIRQVLIDNDIQGWVVIKLLHEAGLIDLELYKDAFLETEELRETEE